MKYKLKITCKDVDVTDLLVAETIYEKFDVTAKIVIEPERFEYLYSNIISRTHIPRIVVFVAENLIISSNEFEQRTEGFPDKSIKFSKTIDREIYETIDDRLTKEGIIIKPNFGQFSVKYFNETINYHFTPIIGE